MLSKVKPVRSVFCVCEGLSGRAWELKKILDMEAKVDALRNRGWLFVPLHFKMTAEDPGLKGVPIVRALHFNF